MCANTAKRGIIFFLVANVCAIHCHGQEVGLIHGKLGAGTSSGQCECATRCQMAEKPRNLCSRTKISMCDISGIVFGPDLASEMFLSDKVGVGFSIGFEGSLFRSVCSDPGPPGSAGSRGQSEKTHTRTPW